jgi:hypothetical protein
MRDSAVPPGRPTSQASVDLVAAAQELAAQGRFLEAAHQLLLACLRSVARHGIIELHPEDTNREVRARLDGASLPGPLRDELLALLGSTERAWFRDRGQDPELYRRWQSTYADLQDLTSRLGAGASAKPPGAVP